MEWISVKDSLPEDDSKVYMVFAKASSIGGGYCDHIDITNFNLGYCEFSNEFNWLVTHWTHMPEFPKD